MIFLPPAFPTMLIYFALRLSHCVFVASESCMNAKQPLHNTLNTHIHILRRSGVSGLLLFASTVPRPDGSVSAWPSPVRLGLAHHPTQPFSAWSSLVQLGLAWPRSADGRRSPAPWMFDSCAVLLIRNGLITGLSGSRLGSVQSQRFQSFQSQMFPEEHL